MVACLLNQPVAQERHAEHQPYCAFCGELPATNRSASCRFEGLRHQRSVKARREGVEVMKWLIAGRGQQYGVNKSFQVGCRDVLNSDRVGSHW